MNQTRPSSSSAQLIEQLTVDNNHLRGRIQELTQRLTALQAENAQLRTQLHAASAGQLYAQPSTSVLALPEILERIAALQAQHSSGGTLQPW